ncbi:flagellar hook-basal body complex protein FliE [Ureibacillus chungkukjangi]|uniref:Flagellar hook-basal body complex protein FliE n=1 Tax=Ureibacillus chungkukjangi TaxID=1202712 RepID=A0A318TQK9_9BACL|nr:flagellar hook-basal body complex protein FliE [Ureibacillus chungkukjangi]MCM3386747.1 flagellar hook-basal body complex protein FliE [Ureibacillus chungkukjangi]PYF07102.1 flagellar hook-basal body complex protein FliE [Ureibacillus chungkukjangi]
MAINPVSLSVANTQIIDETNKIKPAATPFEAQQSFASTLKDAIASVNTQQVQSDVMTQKLINGEDVDLHEVMITAQKASVTLNATMEVRNKAIEAYQEIMRMSI